MRNFQSTTTCSPPYTPIWKVVRIKASEASEKRINKCRLRIINQINRNPGEYRALRYKNDFFDFAEQKQNLSHKIQYRFENFRKRSEKCDRNSQIRNSASGVRRFSGNIPIASRVLRFATFLERRLCFLCLFYQWNDSRMWLATLDQSYLLYLYNICP